MTLPTFLGIGAPRAGTTWLHTLLASHPDVYMPTVRKEIRFFDLYYERGLGWYESFFCSREEAERYRGIGEISPQYLIGEACPQRIASTLPDCRLIVILRHPVDRAYSQYGFFVQRRNYRRSFEEFVRERPRALEKGFYSHYLHRYLRYFDRDRILTLVSEIAFADVAGTKASLAAFLGLDADRFPASAGRRRENTSTVPEHRSLYGLVARTGRRLRAWHLEPLVDLVTRSRVPAILGKGRPLPPLDPELKQRLGRRYDEELDELERCMRIDLSSWRA